MGRIAPESKILAKDGSLQLSETFSFTATQERIRGHDLTLIPEANGNLRKRGVSEFEFGE
jgi:hypothetical protein